MDTPPLSTARWKDLSFDLDDGIRLRRFQESDAQAIFQAVKSNVQHLHFMQWLTPDYSIDSAKEFLERSARAAENGETVGFGIFRGDRFIGSIGFVYIDRLARKTEIGYWLVADEEGKGIISKAARCLIDWAIDVEGMNRIEIRCSALNHRSAAVPRRLGFTQEANLRQSEFRSGKLCDFYVFGLLASESNAERGPGKRSI